jgi:hypothetical protein
MEKDAGEKIDTTERKPLNKLAIIALRELNKNTQASISEIIEAAAAADGIDAAAGWRFDAQAVQWVRPA